MTGYLEFARKHYPEMMGKQVDAGLLLAWIFEHHEHDEKTEIPSVPSIELEKFIQDNAL